MEHPGCVALSHDGAVQLCNNPLGLLGRHGVELGNSVRVLAHSPCDFGAVFGREDLFRYFRCWRNGREGCFDGLPIAWVLVELLICLMRIKGNIGSVLFPLIEFRLERLLLLLCQGGLLNLCVKAVLLAAQAVFRCGPYLFPVEPAQALADSD